MMYDTLSKIVWTPSITMFNTIVNSEIGFCSDTVMQ